MSLFLISEVDPDQGFFSGTGPDECSIFNILFYEGIGALVKKGEVAFPYLELNLPAFTGVEINLGEIL
jgi:hypothetical protein